jgi:hypothetical protein
MSYNFFFKPRQNYSIFFITLAWSGFIFAMIATPMEPSNDFKISYLDKFIHFLLFGVEAELIFLLLYSLNWNKNRSLAYGFIFSFVFALFSEYYQSYVPGRQPSELDLLAGVFGILFFLAVIYFLTEKEKPKLLVHICCAACGGYSAKLLSRDYDVYLFYSNSNIYPALEYEKRKDDINKISSYLDFGKKKIIYDNYNHEDWLCAIKGLENEKEGGERCLKCFEYRFGKTAAAANKCKIRYFTSTLTVSPHKNAEAINKIGAEIANKHNLIFLAVDLKKDDGFKKSTELSKKLGLYRQNYCGCEFSKRK